jgi:hypothetical protein
MQEQCLRKDSDVELVPEQLLPVPVFAGIVHAAEAKRFRAKRITNPTARCIRNRWSKDIMIGNPSASTRQCGTDCISQQACKR